MKRKADSDLITEEPASKKQCQHNITKTNGGITTQEWWKRCTDKMLPSTRTVLQLRDLLRIIMGFLVNDTNAFNQVFIPYHVGSWAQANAICQVWPISMTSLQQPAPRCSVLFSRSLRLITEGIHQLPNNFGIYTTDFHAQPEIPSALLDDTLLPVLKNMLEKLIKDRIPNKIDRILESATAQNQPETLRYLLEKYHSLLKKHRLHSDIIANCLCECFEFSADKTLLVWLSHPIAESFFSCGEDGEDCNYWTFDHINEKMGEFLEKWEWQYKYKYAEWQQHSKMLQDYLIRVQSAGTQFEYPWQSAVETLITFLSKHDESEQFIIPLWNILMNQLHACQIESKQEEEVKEVFNECIQKLISEKWIQSGYRKLVLADAYRSAAFKQLLQSFDVWGHLLSKLSTMKLDTSFKQFIHWCIQNEFLVTQTAVTNVADALMMYQSNENLRGQWTTFLSILNEAGFDLDQHRNELVNYSITNAKNNRTLVSLYKQSSFDVSTIRDFFLQAFIINGQSRQQPDILSGLWYDLISRREMEFFQHTTGPYHDLLPRTVKIFTRSFLSECFLQWKGQSEWKPRRGAIVLYFLYSTKLLSIVLREDLLYLLPFYMYNKARIPCTFNQYRDNMKDDFFANILETYLLPESKEPYITTEQKSLDRIWLQDYINARYVRTTILLIRCNCHTDLTLQSKIDSILHACWKTREILILETLFYYYTSSNYTVERGLIDKWSRILFGHGARTGDINLINRLEKRGFKPSEQFEKRWQSIQPLIISM